MNNKEIISLLKLLEDPDQKVFEIVKTKILESKDFFKIYLENYHSLSSNQLAMDRSESILDEMFFINFENQLNNIFSESNPKLSDAVFLLETYFNRDIDLNQLVASFDEIVRSIWIELNEQLTGIEKVKIISSVLHKEYRFKKYPVGEFNQEYFNMTNCIMHKKFVPPTIALLYCMIAQQTQIPIFPVNIPGIFLISYVDQDLADAVYADENNGIVFSIHPYEMGNLINQQIVEKYLTDNNVDLKFSDIKIQSYFEYLAFIFELRILTIKQKTKKGFCLEYADKVKDIFNSRFNTNSL